MVSCFCIPCHLPRRAREKERPEKLRSSKSTVQDSPQRLLITRIRAKDITARLRRIPVGFYVTVESDAVSQKTSIKALSVGNDLIEWDEEMILSSDPSSTISFTIIASFELGPTLGNGGVLRKFESTVGELLDRLPLIKFSKQEDAGASVIIEVEIDQRGHESIHVATTNPTLAVTEEMYQLAQLTDMGHAALARYRERQEERDLDQSITHFERAQSLCPLDHPSRATVLFNLASAKLICCKVNDTAPDLDMAIDLYRIVLSLRPHGHVDHPSTLLSLGVALLARFQRNRVQSDEEEGQTLLSQVQDIDSYSYLAAVLALGSTAKPELIDQMQISDRDVDWGVQWLDANLQRILHADPSPHIFLDHIGVLLCVKLDSIPRLVELEKAIPMLQVIVRSTSDSHPEKTFWLDDIGSLLLTLHERVGDAVNLDQSISMREEAVRLIAHNGPSKATFLGNLANSFSRRYECSGDSVDLEKSISLAEEVLQLTPDDYPGSNKALRLNNLGNLLKTRYERFGEIVDLEKSISLAKEALQLVPDGHPDKALRLAGLATSLATRYKRFGEIVDLEKLISLTEEGLQLTPDGHPNKALHLNNLGYSLSTRYQRFGDIVDLEKSISLTEEALRLTPDGHPDRALRLTRLGFSLSTRYERFGDVVDLEKSISLREEGLQLMPDGHPKKASWLNNLGYSLSTRYERFGDIVDLEKSISRREEALRLTPNGHPSRASRLTNLGYSLLTRYVRFGDVVDQEKSISLTEEALRLTPDGHPDKIAQLNNLGYSLSMRYVRFGDVVDLEKSISVTQEALQFMPDGHPDKALRLTTLASSFSTRYGRFGDVVDLEKSISSIEEALQLMPDGHPKKAIHLSSLASLLSTRYERFGNVADLEKSISLIGEALQLTPDGHPDKASRLTILGSSSLMRYEHFGDMIDLEKSISMREEALQLTPDGHPLRCIRLCNLSDSLLRRFLRSGDSSNSDLTCATAYSSQAARSPTGSPSHRFQSSQRWIECARLQHDPQSLLDAYIVIVDLLPQLAWMGLSLHDRYHQLLQATDIVCDAAAAALDAHQPGLAVEWLEQGRSIMWGQLSQLRTPVDALRVAYPEFAAQFEHTSHELEWAGGQNEFVVKELTNYSYMVKGILENQAKQQHTLALERERLIAEIRALPGFERFLLPKTIAKLSSLAQSGPVVFLNASKYRCDALVVKPGLEHVIHVPLSKTSYEEVGFMRVRLSRLLSYNARVISRDSDNTDRGARLSGMTPKEVFGHILPALWEKVVKPILDALDSTTPTGELSRVFWCPTGPFSFLPVHAAGHYGPHSSGRKVSDFVISSYIPTMAALQLQEELEATSNQGHVRLLAVPQPSTDGERQLRCVPEEMRIIKELTSLSPFVELKEADGTVEDVLGKMAKSDWVHFACHGTQDRTKPLDSGLLLAHCTRLKLSDIVRLSYPHGGLAFLSACQTATGDEQLSEEAIHLAAGMLLAGYKSVIATMWSIMDSDAPKVTEDVYKKLLECGEVPDSSKAAEALHHAIERLRDSGAPFLSWVPFIHVGS